MILDDEHFQNEEYKTFNYEECSDCSFEACHFQGCDLKGVAFLDCDFKACNFSMAEMAGASFKGCHFEECKLVGLNASELQALDRCQFQKCMLDDAIFMNLNIPHFIFRNSRLRGVDFSEANLSSSQFTACDLVGATFRDTNLSQCDFSSATGYEIDIRYNKVKKAVFTWPEAASLLAGLEIIVK